MREIVIDHPGTATLATAGKGSANLAKSLAARDQCPSFGTEHQGNFQLHHVCFGQKSRGRSLESLKSPKFHSLTYTPKADRWLGKTTLLSFRTYPTGVSVFHTLCLSGTGRLAEISINRYPMRIRAENAAFLNQGFGNSPAHLVLFSIGRKGLGCDFFFVGWRRLAAKCGCRRKCGSLLLPRPNPSPEHTAP